MKQEKKRITIFRSCLVLTLLIAIVYCPVTTYDDIGYDDSTYVFENPYVQSGFNKQAICWAFTTTHASNWHPLTWLSYMLDSELFGNKPGIYHWMNLNYHIINALLLFIVLTKMTGHILKSFIVAAFFGIHPLHVESVAWISERKDVLSTLMVLISLYAYTCYVQQGHQIHYCLVILFFLLSLLSKPMMVTFPFVLLLLDIWPLSRSNALFVPQLIEKIPLLIISFVFCVITVWAQHSGGACQSLDAISMTSRMLNAVAAYGWYVYKLFLPVNLAIFYPHPQSNVSFISVTWGAIVIIMGLWIAIRFRHSYPYILTGMFWFLGTLVPVIGLVQVGLQAYADRYAYIPLTGLFILITWGVFDIGLYLSDRNKKIERWLAIVFMAIVFIYSYLCGLQVRTWKNGTSVFQHALMVVPDNYVAMTHLGTIPLLKKALLLRPHHIPALHNLGTALIHEGKLHEALGYLLKAERLNSQHPNIYNNIGGIYYELNNYPLSLKYFQKALEINPNQASTQKNIQQVYKKMSQQKDSP